MDTFKKEEKVLMIYFIPRYIKIVFMICLLCAIELVQCKGSFEILDPSYDQKNIKIIKVQNKDTHVYVTIVEDQLYKKKYCVKQYHAADKIFFSLKEILISGIAESANVPVNCVRLISAETFFPGKCYKKRMATLHTFTPGKSLKSSGNYSGVDIQQFKQKRGVFGITRTIIDHMSLSPNLAQIVALDTLIGGTNHSRGNIFFDEESNDFYGIDLKKAFRKNLSRLAYENIKKMYVVKFFTSRQIDVLKIYRDTLKKLITKNPPGDICRNLDALVKTANLKKQRYFFGNEYLYLLDKQLVPLTGNTVKECKVMIFQSYDSVQQLVALLDEIIKKHTK